MKRRGHRRKTEKMSPWLNLMRRSPSISPDRSILKHTKKKRRLLSKVTRDKQDSSNLTDPPRTPESLDHQRLGLMIAVQ